MGRFGELFGSRFCDVDEGIVRSLPFSSLPSFSVLTPPPPYLSLLVSLEPFPHPG
jgi:hypothetical protein